MTSDRKREKLEVEKRFKKELDSIKQQHKQDIELITTKMQAKVDTLMDVIKLKDVEVELGKVNRDITDHWSSTGTQNNRTYTAVCNPQNNILP